MRKRALVTSCVLAAALAALLIGTSQAASPSAAGCRTVKGKLVDERAVPGPGVRTSGTLIGALRGSYEFEVTWTSGAVDPTIPTLLHFEGKTVVHTKSGDIYFTEAGVIDTGGEGNYVNLMTVTGGTGKWAGASGQIALVGAFSFATGEGAARYSGEICTA